MLAKQTAYKGINFRSRLEARWAAFFDIVGWVWEYEPECDGLYIPDFLLHGGAGRKVYVEVKPLATFLGDVEAILRKARDVIGWGEELLVLTDQFPDAWGFDAFALGFLADDDSFGYDQAILFKPDGYDFAGESGSWQGRLSGAYDGNALFEATMLSKAELLTLWSRAGNVIQWKPGGKVLVP